MMMREGQFKVQLQRETREQSVQTKTLKRRRIALFKRRRREREIPPHLYINPACN